MQKNSNDLLGEMSFDSSLYNTLDSKLSIQEYRGMLTSLLQPILDQRFSSASPKSKILHKHDRINFACPYCGDSMKSDYSKRGNFIFTGKYRNFYKCHNCGEFKRIDQFFKEYKVELKLDAINYTMDNLGDFTSYEGGKFDMSALLDMEHIDKYALGREEIMEFFKLVEVKDSAVWSWLKNRHQYDTSKFLYNPAKNYLLILNLTPSGKILGVQKRTFSGNNRFETYKLSKLYQIMNKELDVNEEQKDYLDMLSMVFNICLLNFSKPITLFEGPMDAFLFKNSIANTGANKELQIDIPVRYWYDSDATGKRKAMQHLEMGHEIFLWEKFILDIGAPHKLKHDWNDIVTWAKTNNVQLPIIDNYFSDDQLDLIDL